jgi:hypothetical protein
VAIKFGSPVLTIAALAVIVNQPNLAAQPLLVLFLLALPFAVPLLLAAIYPLVRWTPQEWRLDDAGLHGRGRVSGDCPWSGLASWTMTPAAGLPDVQRVVFRRAPAWRHLPASMLVPTVHRAAALAWLGTGRDGESRTSAPAPPPRPVPAG